MNEYMKEALIEANKAFELGEVPIGAIIVHNNIIIGRGFNKKESLKNPVMHAEIEAIQEASKKIGDWRLDGCDLYVTVEPCMMCTGAIIQSRIKRLVYGVKNDKFGASDLFALGNHNSVPEIVPSVMEIECKKILQKFFEIKRGK